MRPLNLSLQRLCARETPESIEIAGIAYLVLKGQVEKSCRFAEIKKSGWVWDGREQHERDVEAMHAARGKLIEALEADAKRLKLPALRYRIGCRLVSYCLWVGERGQKSRMGLLVERIEDEPVWSGAGTGSGVGTGSGAETGIEPSPSLAAVI